MKTLLLILLLSTVPIASGKLSDDDSIKLPGNFKIEFPREKIMDLLSNEDVYWSGEYSGLVPYLSPNAEAILSVLRENREGKIIERLQVWLADRERFIVAHVLLTLADPESKYETSASTWNTLRVVTSEGHGKYDYKQMESLRQKWGKTYKRNGQPNLNPANEKNTPNSK